MILVIDDFIQDQELLKKIRDDKTIFADPGIYYYWEGWWESPANTVKKSLIKYVWGDNCPLNMTFDVFGFEYWTGIQSAEDDNPFLDNLGLHYDKDEALFSETGKLQTTMFSTVYYPEQKEFSGGMLEIFTKGLDREPERIYALPNRLIIFNGGDFIHSVSKVTSGTRKAISINLWGESPYSLKTGKLKKE